MSESNSSKFYGLSLVFHVALVALVIYLNYPAIKEKLKPDPLAVEIQTAPKAEVAQAPVVAPEETPVAEKKIETVSAPVKMPVAETKPVSKNPSSSDTKNTVKKSADSKARLKIEEFKNEEKLTSASIKLPTKSTLETPDEVARPREITETPIKDDSIPLPNLVSLDPETGVIEGAEPVQKLEPSSSLSNQSNQLRSNSNTPTDALSDALSTNSRSSTNNLVREELRRPPAKTTIIETATTESTVTEEISRPSIAAPAPEEVREIGELRQRPGNPLPRYSDIERLRRHEGQVSYMAYVTPEGRLTNFILAQSSGHANLDQKTLNSLKAWRFYPGQEGWVEIPQVWVLTGEAEEYPSQLRR